jgi:tyrosyl-tRNA synthetase
MKTPWELAKIRAKYYKKCFESLGMEKVEYVFDSDFKYDKDYAEKVYKLSVLVTQKRALRAASEVCRLRNPKVSELLYPVMQTVDCWKLGVDVAYSGTDQRHIYMLSREILPKIGLKQPTLVMTPMLSGLVKGVKSSASVPESNIKIYDEPSVIKKKIASAWCPPEAEGNPVLEYYKYIIFPRFGSIKIKRPEKFGGDIEFKEYKDLERNYLTKSIHPSDIKSDLAKRLAEILEPCRKFFEKKKDLIKEAYP